MNNFIGEFLGFSLGGYHSSTLNIVRVSTNDRYVENLLPSFQNLTATVIGGNGTYYWGANYTQKIFTIDFAFDDLHDVDISRLKKIFGSTEVQPLIFDEAPYKKYMVKSAAPPILKYICFTDYDTNIYKGEGSVQLISFYPFAIGVQDQNIRYEETGSMIGNNGELEGEWQLIYKISDLNNDLSLQLKQNDQIIKSLTLNNIDGISGDEYIKIDSRTNLIEGLDASFNKTGTLYNKYIISGDLFKLPLEQSFLISNIEFVDGKYILLYY